MRHNAHLGQKIIAARDNRSMTRATLARIAGLSEDFVKRVETGIINPSGQTVRRIAAALGVDESDLEPATPPADTALRDRLQRFIERTRGELPLMLLEKPDRLVYDACLEAWKRAPEYEIGAIIHFGAWLYRRDIRRVEGLLAELEGLLEGGE